MISALILATLLSQDPTSHDWSEFEQPTFYITPDFKTTYLDEALLAFRNTNSKLPANLVLYTPEKATPVPLICQWQSLITEPDKWIPNDIGQADRMTAVGTILLANHQYRGHVLYCQEKQENGTPKQFTKDNVHLPNNDALVSQYEQPAPLPTYTLVTTGQGWFGIFTKDRFD